MCTYQNSFSQKSDLLIPDTAEIVQEKNYLGYIYSEFSDCIEVFVCDLLILIKILYITKKNYIKYFYQPKGVFTNIVEGEVQFLKNVNLLKPQKKRRPPKYKKCRPHLNKKHPSRARWKGLVIVVIFSPKAAPLDVTCAKSIASIIL